MEKSNITMVSDDKLIFTVGKWNVYELSEQYFIIQAMTNIEVLTYSFYHRSMSYGEAIDAIIEYASKH